MVTSPATVARSAGRSSRSGCAIWHVPRSGVDPKLILVVNLGGPVADDEFRRAGLRCSIPLTSRSLIAFVDDPQMAGFLERLDTCAAGVPPGRQSEPYAAFVDAIDSVRELQAG